MPLDKKSLRNLVQYKNLSEEEFEEVYQSLIKKTEEERLADEKYRKRFHKKLKDFEKDYDLSDLKPNDKEMLFSLIDGILTLEDLEVHSRKIRQKDSLTDDDTKTLKDLSYTISRVRGDVSDIQDDLRIARKERETEEDVSVLNYIEDLKKKAQKFYRKKLNYVFCPKCEQLIFTGWFLHPEEENIVKLTCGRTIRNDKGNEEICGHRFEVTSKELIKNKNKNLEEKLV